MSFTIELTTPACPVKDQMRDEAQAAVAALPGVTEVAVEMTASVRSALPAETARAPIPGVRNVIAVGAGKGGVGKTTVAVNVAVALARYGGRVGMIDGDVYGPNVPIMLGLDARLSTDGKKIVPARKHGISVVSMGFSRRSHGADHLARPDAPRRGAAVLPGRGLGRAGTTWSSTCRPGRATWR